MKDKYKVCSLFAGIGGIDLAFQQAGFEIVWANELDSDACKTYRYNFQNTVLTEGDIRKSMQTIYRIFIFLPQAFLVNRFRYAVTEKVSPTKEVIFSLK